VADVRRVPGTPAVVTRSSSFPVGAFYPRHQAVRALRADPVRSFDGHGGPNGRRERLPVTGHAADTFAPRALRDPDGIVTANTEGRHGVRGRALIGRTVIHSGRRGARCGTLRIGRFFGGRPDVISDQPQG